MEMGRGRGEGREEMEEDGKEERGGKGGGGRGQGGGEGGKGGGREWRGVKLTSQDFLELNSGKGVTLHIYKQLYVGLINKNKVLSINLGKN